MAAPSHPGRGGLRRGPEPYRQGDLDSLCGIYAIVNAIGILCPDLDERAALALFTKLLRSLGSFVEQPTEIVYEGINEAILRHLLTIATAYAERRLKVVMEVRPYRRPKGRITVPKFWQTLRERISERQIAILSTSGAHDHWTVVYAVNADALGLLDSSDLRTLPRRQLTLEPARTRFQLILSEVIFVERID